MKQTFYLHRFTDGDMFISKRENREHSTAIGTVELDVQPIKKEVEKVIVPRIEHFDINENWLCGGVIPKDAYDVKVVYKVKE